MPDQLTLDLFQERFVVGLLFFVRVTGLMVVAPFFSNTGIMPTVKVALAAAIALLMSVAFGEEQPAVQVEPMNLLVLVFKEALVGIIIGYCSNLMFQAVRFAGGLADFDMGYQTAALFNLNLNSPTLVGEVKWLVAMMLFLVLNGHHFLIEATYASVTIIPVTTFSLSGPTAELLIGLVTTMFLIGVKIAAPILIALFITNLALALLARVAPQINIFILSFQFKIIIGLLVLMLTAPIFIIVVKNALELFEGRIMDVLMSIKAARSFG